MRDLTSVGWIKFKAVLFLLLGSVTAAMLIVEHPELKVVGLLMLVIWCFCRFYYFAFYVIEHYVDPGFKFSGLGSFIVWMISKRGRGG